MPAKEQWPLKQQYDVIVVGSGAAGLLAALRSAEAGLDAIVLEKAHMYGGTSATSGGAMWIPNHGLEGHQDTREQALTYLRHITEGEAHEDRLGAYVDNAPRMLSFLKDAGIPCDVFPGYPDYYPDAPGAVLSRAVVPQEIDGAELGEDYFTMRMPFQAFTLFNRYSLNLAQAFALSAQPPGWRWVAAKMFLTYWLDLPWRLKARRDRRATMGNALVGGLRRELQRRGVPVLLNTGLVAIHSENGKATAIEAQRNGTLSRVEAKRGIVLAAGGFEQSQQLRDEHLPVPTSSKWSLSPPGGNIGDTLRAGRAIGADTEFLEYCWWAPSMQLPSAEIPNANVTHQMFFDHRHPHSVVVNRLGKRFVNESCAYDDFGMAMIADQQKTGANTPCWMIFDATYREKYTCGGIMPNAAMPDRKIPPHWWDNYLYRAASIAELAGKIGVPADALEGTVKAMNTYAANGKDPEFHRGDDDYDRFFGDQRMQPNPCMGPIDNAPYYAVRVDLGDLGTKGGLKVDADARVIATDGRPIEGLYAVGNCSASPFANRYPGAGGTIGPAMTFAYVAAGHIAQRNR